MFNEGEVGGIEGGAIWVEVRLEVFLGVRRGTEGSGRGEGGIVFRSGAMASVVGCSTGE
jgi:hypothetical protein